MKDFHAKIKKICDEIAKKQYITKEEMTMILFGTKNIGRDAERNVRMDLLRAGFIFRLRLVKNGAYVYTDKNGDEKRRKELKEKRSAYTKANQTKYIRKRAEVRQAERLRNKFLTLEEEQDEKDKFNHIIVNALDAYKLQKLGPSSVFELPRYI